VVAVRGKRVVCRYEGCVFLVIGGGRKVGGKELQKTMFQSVKLGGTWPSG
jgi:hypothetical protein